MYSRLNAIYINGEENWKIVIWVTLQTSLIIYYFIRTEPCSGALRAVIISSNLVTAVVAIMSNGEKLTKENYKQSSEFREFYKVGQA